MLACPCQNGFGMKLHSFDRITRMPEAHDNAVIGFCSDFEVRGNASGCDNQGVIPCGNEGIFHTFKKTR